MRHHESELLSLRPDVEDLVLHVHARKLVQRAERLVEQQYLRLVDERAHERHALRHAAGELRGIVVPELFQPDHANHTIHPLGFSVFHTAYIQTECNILFHREPREKRRILEHNAALRRGRFHFRAVYRNTAERRRDEPRHKPEDRGLTAAGRPDEGDELPAFHRNAHILQRMGHLIAFDLGKHFADVFKRQADIFLLFRHHFSAPFCHLRR